MPASVGIKKLVTAILDSLAGELGQVRIEMNEISHLGDGIVFSRRILLYEWILPFPTGCGN